MTRYIYGGGGDAQSVTTTGTVRPSAAANVYNARTGGAIVTDIQDMLGNPLSGTVTTDTYGQAIFQGPDGYTSVLWLDFGVGPRWALAPKDAAAVSTLVQTNARTADNTGTSLTTKASIPYKASVPLWQNAAGVLDPMVEPRFATQAARDAAFPTPADGDHCFRTDLHAKQWYHSGVARWVTDRALIKEVVVGTPSFTITVSSIPNVWRNLKLVFAFGGTDAANHGCYMQFNGDNTADYDRQATRVSNGVNAYDASASDTQMLIGQNINSGFSAATFANSTIEIANYASTSYYKHVVFNCIFGNANGGLAGLGHEVGGGVWKNIAAITSITLNAGVGNFKVGTTLSVYGEA